VYPQRRVEEQMVADVSDKSSSRGQHSEVFNQSNDTAYCVSSEVLGRSL